MKEKHLTSIEIKGLVMYYYRYIRHWPLVATEVSVLNNFFADVVAASYKELVEVEIKTSLEDFEHEFKTKESKHNIYRWRYADHIRARAVRTPSLKD